MTHEDAANYAGKHPDNKLIDPRIAGAIQSRVDAGRIACARAFGAATELDVSPAEVGRHLDLMEIRIDKCQLGLFGYPKKSKAVEPASEVSLELAAAIEEALVAGRLPCAEAWAIAERMNLAKMELAAACEAQGVKVSSCQLGSF